MSQEEDEEQSYISETDKEVGTHEEDSNNSDENNNNDNENKDDSNNEEDDLFGDGDNDDSEEEDTIIKPAKRIVEDGDELAEEIEEESDEGEDEEEVEQREIKTIDLDLAKHSSTNKSTDDEIYYTTLPAFLNVEPLPFEALGFKDAINEKQQQLETEEERVMEKLFAENVIRWRYNKKGDHVLRQSNAHFIEWSDGSLSLKLGKEIFDVVRNPSSDNFLTVRHNEIEVFQTDAIFTKNVKLIPSSANSEIHKRLTNYIKTKNTRNDTVNEALIDVDPEEVLRQKEKAEEETIRNRRKLEQRKLMEEERMEKTGRSSSRSQSYGSYGYEDGEEEEEEQEGRDRGNVAATRSNGYFDDEDDDDFVAEDDEEISNDDEEDELEKSERLNRLKEQGAQRYADDEEEDDDEEAVKVTKKRRVIADDEDDE